MSYMEGKVIRLTIKLIMNLTMQFTESSCFDPSDKDL